MDGTARGRHKMTAVAAAVARPNSLSVFYCICLDVLDNEYSVLLRVVLSVTAQGCYISQFGSEIPAFITKVSKRRRNGGTEAIDKLSFLLFLV